MWKRIFIAYAIIFGTASLGEFLFPGAFPMIIGLALGYLICDWGEARHQINQINKLSMEDLENILKEHKKKNELRESGTDCSGSNQ